MERLESISRKYAWGSKTAIPELIGIPPDGTTWAELWVSAYQQGSSTLTRNPDTALCDIIVDDPIRYLGSDVVRRFGARLPFLMKVIAPAHPLSIQVHPTRDQARLGFEREESHSVVLAQRTYVDSFHKPEMLYALEEFEILAGFQPAHRSAQALRAIALPKSCEWAEILEAAKPEEEGKAIRAVFLDITSMESVDADFVNDFVAAAIRAVAQEDLADDVLGPLRTVVEMAQVFPGDRGALLAILLNRSCLRSGEAVFIDSGMVHCYLRGIGIEIMAASDNVLRAGLTQKHVDADELIKNTDFEPSLITTIQAQETDGVRLFCPGAEEFCLRVLDVSEGSVASLSAQGPRLVLVINGCIRIQSGQNEVTLCKGESALIADSDGPVQLNGIGQLVVGEVPSA